MEEKRKRPNVISTINDNNITYYFCDDGDIYKMNEDKTKLIKIGKEEREAITSKYKEKSEKQTEVSFGER